MQPTHEELVRLYRLMLLTRRTEEAVDALFKQGKIRGMGHWSTGQEAAGVGVAAALRSDDYLFPTHRGWPEYIGKGMQPASIVAEIAGKATGCSRGKGSVHLSSASDGVVGLVGSLGSDFPIAVGAALSAQMRGTDQVACVYFGEGTVTQGDFHPAMEMAMLWNLPVIFACVNNQYAQLLHYKALTHLDNVLDLAQGYHMRAIMVSDGNNVAAVYDAMSEAVSGARAGLGSSMLEIKTYRVAGHYTGDPGDYMPKEQVASWKGRDPIACCRARLLMENMLTEKVLAEMESGVEQQVQAGMKFVLDSPLPTVDDLYTGVYVDHEVTR